MKTNFTIKLGVFKYKKNNFNFLVAGIFAVIGLQQINLASTINLTTKIQTTNEIIALNAQARTPPLNTKKSTYLEEVSDDLNAKSTITSQGNKSNLSNNRSANNSNHDKGINQSTKVVKMTSLPYFLLLFISPGIFYIFLLSYKKLLSREKVKSAYLENSYNSGQVFDYINLEKQDVVKAKDNYQATVSKLQIAFSSEANDLQEKLAQTVLSVEVRTDQGLIELMHKTLSILIDPEYWTHVNHTSISLPLQDVKAEFDAILDAEHNKLIREKVKISHGNIQLEKSSEPGYNDNFNYIVVTLVLCTSHKKPLFNIVHTKEQLIEELVELSKMRKEKLIKFDLLWNPRTANKYINNNQLLRDYGDMLRLF